MKTIPNNMTTRSITAVVSQFTAPTSFRAIKREDPQGKLLEGYDLAKMDEAHRVHTVVEAMRRAYRDRGAYLGDPDFVKMPIARLTSDKRSWIS